MQTGAEQHGPDVTEDVRRGKSEVTEGKKAQTPVTVGSGTTSDNDGLLQRDECGTSKPVKQEVQYKGSELQLNSKSKRKRDESLRVRIDNNF